MAGAYLQTSGDFDRLESVLRVEALSELSGFMTRIKPWFRELHLHAHLKRLNASLGNNPLLQCNLHLVTEKGRFHVSEEGFGVEAAVKNALLDLRYRIERKNEIRHEQHQKAEGRKALAFEN